MKRGALLLLLTAITCHASAGFALVYVPEHVPDDRSGRLPADPVLEIAGARAAGNPGVDYSPGCAFNIHRYVCRRLVY